MIKVVLFILLFDIIMCSLLYRRSIHREKERCSKLYVIEGMDGAGKHTQSTLLYEKMQKYYSNTHDIILLSFPNYDNDISSKQLKEYLKGNCKITSEYQSSLFYTIDRVYTMVNATSDNGKTLLERFNNGRCIVIADRYTTSNLLHQGMNLDNKSFKKYVKMMENIEYTLCELPKPDKVIYLDVDVDVSMNNILNRSIETNREIDIHENKEHLLSVYKKRNRVINKLKWNRVVCSDNGLMRDMDEISDEIYNYIINK